MKYLSFNILIYCHISSYRYFTYSQINLNKKKLLSVLKDYFHVKDRSINGMYNQKLFQNFNTLKDYCDYLLIFKDENYYLL